MNELLELVKRLGEETYGIKTKYAVVEARQSYEEDLDEECWVLKVVKIKEGE